MTARAKLMGSRLLFACVVTAIPLFARTLVVDQRHANANDANPGTEARPLATINRAAQLAQPGDTVLVHAGVYRERVAPARGGLPGKPITYTSAAGERVFIRGSAVFKPRWRAVNGAPGMYTATLESPELQQYNPFLIPLKVSRTAGGTLGQVFVNGCALEEVTELAAVRAGEGRWMVWNGALLVHFPHAINPESSLVEISVRRRVFAPLKRGLGYIVVRGFVIEHCANQYPSRFWDSSTPQEGALGTRAGHHWVIEDNIVRHAKSIGVDVGSEGERDSDGLGQRMPEIVGDHLVQRNIVSDNGVCGIAGWNHRGTRVLGNIVERNGTLHTDDYEEAGMKFHQLLGGLIDGNLVHDNETRGIWMDNRNLGSRVTRNVLYNNRSEGIFVELESGPVLVDRNIICCSRASVDGGRKADGYYMHDASGVVIERNLIFNNPEFGINMRVATERTLDTPTGMVEASDNRIRGNIIVQNATAALSMPASGQRTRDNFSDGNAFDTGAMFDRTVFPNTTGVSDDLRMVGIDSWRLLTGFDEQSQMADVRVQFSRGSATLEIEMPPLARPAFGPFPSLKNGKNRIRVWPVEGIGGPDISEPEAPGCAVASK